MVPGDQPLKPNSPQDETLLFETALNALAKALKAINFYPPEHPQREESISGALTQLSQLVSDRELILLWNRDACTVADRPLLKSTSATAKTLAREMLTRKLQRLVILPRVSLKDLKAFLAVVTKEPGAIYAGGGIEKAMVEAGITSIGANEIDLSLLQAAPPEDAGAEEQDAPEESAEEESTTDDPEAEDKNPCVEEEDSRELEFSVLGLDILLGMLNAEKNEHQFVQLAREVIAAAEELKRQDALDLLLPAMATLVDILAVDRPASQREFIRYTLEQIAGSNMTEYLLDRIEERTPENETILDRICAAIGQALAYPLIQRLCVVESLHARKSLAIALSRSGEAAIPALVPMLKDERWYVVRNIVTILGEIGSAEALSALQQTARHPEPKVRKELIKALLKISPQAAEQTLIFFIDDEDRDVVHQAIYSLGAIRSKAAVRRLLEIVTETDTFLKNLVLKKMAVAAIGRIGDRQTSSVLLDILFTRGWLAPARWQDFKIATAAALGQLGDETAIPLLKKLARRDTPLGIACGDAADNLERLAK